MLWYLKNLLIALDQLINAVAGGWADETLSSRSHRARLAGHGAAAAIIDVLFLDGNHCADAYESERIGRQLPPELRGKTWE